MPVMSDQPSALIVDDSIETTYILQRALEENGYAVQIVHDGEQAATMLETLAPDLVMLDLNLPFVSGQQLLAQIKTAPQLQQTFILVISADTDELENLVGQVDAIISKPVLYSQLRHAIAGLSRSE
jgi:two-component system, OmpR family, response regulator TrcR